MNKVKFRIVLPILILMSFLFWFKPLDVNAATQGGILVVGSAEQVQPYIGSGAGAERGWIGTVYRMTAISCRGEDPISIAAETGAFDDGGSTIIMKSPFQSHTLLDSCPRYGDARWFYFCTKDSFYRSKDFPIATTFGKAPYYRAVYSPNTSNEIPKLFFDTFGDTFSEIDNNIQLTLSDTDVYYYNNDVLTNILGLGSGVDNYIVIIEAVPIYKNTEGCALYPSSSSVWSEEFVKPNSEGKLVITHAGMSANEFYATGNIYGFNNATINKINTDLVKEGNNLPFGYLNIANKDTCGYALYGKAFGAKFGNPIAMNVHVQYSGDPLTSDAPTNVATSFLTKNGKGNEDTSGYTDVHDTYNDSYKYFNFARKTWTNSGDWDELAQHARFNVSSEPPFKMIYADAYTTTPTKNILFTQLENAINGQTYSMSWMSTLVSGGTHNIGYKTQPDNIDGYRGTQGIANKLAMFDGFSALTYVVNVPCEDRDMASIIRETVNKAWLQSGRSAITTNEGDGSRNVMLNANVPVGVAIEFSAKGVPVTSRKCTLEVAINADGSREVNFIKPPENWTAEYSSLDQAYCELGEDVTAWVVVPNDAVENSTTCAYDSAVEALGNTVTKGNAYSQLQSVVSNIQAKGQGSAKLALGSTITTPIVGYTIYEIKVTDSVLPTGQCELPAWMLNRYYPYIINSSTQMKNKVKEEYGDNITTGLMITLRKDWTNYNDGDRFWYGEMTCTLGDCDECGGCHATIIRPYHHKTPDEEATKCYDITWYDISGGSWHTNNDNGAAGTYFPTMKSGTVWENAKRGTLLGGARVGTETNGNNSCEIHTDKGTKDWTDDHQYKTKWTIDYGFNLCRASVGDKKTFSGVTHASNPDGGDVLKNDFDIVPKTIKKSTPTRNSGAIIGSITDTLSFRSGFTHFGGGNGEQWYKDYHRHGNCYTYPEPEADDGAGTGSTEGSGDGAEGTEVEQEPEPILNHAAFSIEFWTNRSKSCIGLKAGSSSASTVSHSWTSIVFKYSTETMPKGWNTKCGSGVDAHAPLMDWTEKLNNGHVQDGNEYRAATVRNNSVTLNFYPDVLMVARFAGSSLGETTLSGCDGSGYEPLAVMGEAMRMTNSSGIYLYKINGTGDGAITGATYSDAMLGGSATQGSDLVIVPAGTDVNVVVDTQGITIDCYGYILDLVDKSYDSNVFATGGNGYNLVVRSGMNVYQKWMGTSQFSVLQNHFDSWCDAILDIENYAADLHLEVDGHSDDMYNFSATIGNISKQGVTYSNMSYQLVVEQGTLQTGKGGYSELISQIAADYQCSESEAESLFQASGMWQSIRESIEHCGASVNKSGSTGTCQGTKNPDTAIASAHQANGTAWHNCNGSWTSLLGGGGNWYDEKVYTFVVRRFTSEGNQFKNIIATDKIDYSLAPTGKITEYQDINSGNSNKGTWYLTLCFNKEKASVVNDKLIGSGTYLDLYNGSDHDDANNGLTVLIKKAPVRNADFLIPAQSTDTFGRH